MRNVTLATTQPRAMRAAVMAGAIGLGLLVTGCGSSNSDGAPRSSPKAVSTTAGKGTTDPSPSPTTTTTRPAPASAELPAGWPAGLVPPKDCILLSPKEEMVEGTRIVGIGCLRPATVSDSLDALTQMATDAGFEPEEPTTYEDPPAGRFEARKGNIKFSASVVQGASLRDYSDYFSNDPTEGSSMSMAVVFEP